MSEIKVNKITPRAACGTTQLGDSGDTITIPSGATIQNLGTATGFGGTGVVSWETSSIKTAGFTAVTGTGYFCDTTGGAFTVTLPLSPSAGDVVGVADYAKTFDTANLTLGRNGSNIGGLAVDATISTEGVAVTLVYVDATKGWIVTDSGNQTDAPTEQFVAATGGCVTTCGDFKMHTFTGPGALCVSAVGNPAGSNTVSYLVVAGGGSGGTGNWAGGGGGGAGGFREGLGINDSYTGSPLRAPTGVPVTATPYPITVGGGAPAATTTTGVQGAKGSDSVFSTITSAGGGGGNGADCGSNPSNITSPGGSGGGGSANMGAYAPSYPNTGAGNTPPVSPPQGNSGGDSSSSSCNGPNYPSGGGGGAGAAGGVATNKTSPGMPGGAGAQTQIDTNNYYYAGGGGGTSYNGTPGGDGGLGGGGGSGTSPGPAGVGAGGAGGGTARTTGSGGGCGGTKNGGSGGDNTGGGGGGTGGPLPATNGGGGSGIVVIRYKYQ